MSETEVKNLIKFVGINLITINLIWIGIKPLYFMPPIYCNIKFYGIKYNFNVYDLLPYFQGILTLKIVYDIKNA